MIEAGGPPPDAPYQACYCEENAWHLCGHATLPAGRRAVVFVSNPARTVAFAAHRAAAEPDGLVVWDYHVVVAVVTDDGSVRIFDPDSTLELGVALPRWGAVTFGDPPRLGAPLQPEFRVVAADDYRRDLRSDRRHMRREDGSWLAPPPAWPLIGGDGGSNLDTYVDTRDTAGPGRLAPFAELAATIEAVAR